MNQNKILKLCVVVLLLCSSAGFALESGEKALPFDNLDLSKRHVLSKNYLGKGRLILDLFATDCEGCKKELPVLERLHRDFSGQGIDRSQGGRLQGRPVRNHQLHSGRRILK